MLGVANPESRQSISAERQPKPALRKRDTSSLFDAPFSWRGIVVRGTSSDTPRLPATMKIEEVQSTTKKQRVATHTHIKVRRGRVRLLRRRPITRTIAPVNRAPTFDFLFQDAFPRMRDRRARSRVARSPRAPPSEPYADPRTRNFLSA